MVKLDFNKSQYKDKQFIFSLDAETNSLYGDLLSIGISIYDIKYKRNVNYFMVLKEFYEGKIQLDPWVLENVVPVMYDFYTPIILDKTQLLNTFWDLWLKYKNDSICLIDFGIPVESELFAECIKLDPGTRAFQGPYPAIDLGTLLFAANLDPDS